MYSPESAPPLPHRGNLRSHQRGVALIELLVGLTIGLLVIAAALGTLLLSRGASTSVSDISQLQQQGSYALRVIGIQFRQAGSVELIHTSNLYSFSNEFVGFSGGPTVVAGGDGTDGGSDQVSVSNQPSTVLATQRRDCLGTEVMTGARIDSTFYVQEGQLYCKGMAKQAQPIIGNVADFQVTYRIKTDAGTQAMTAAAVNEAKLWASVSSIEVCLDLKGNESGNPEVGATYQTCQLQADGTPKRVSRAGRIHLVYRNVFDLRTQGVI